MKIQNDVSHALQSTDKATAKSASTATTRPASTTSPLVSVSISDTSRALQLTGNTDAPFDANRVEAIKAAISSGQFKVNPEAVADKVIDSASQLLSGQA